MPEKTHSATTSKRSTAHVSNPVHKNSVEATSGPMPKRQCIRDKSCVEKTTSAVQNTQRTKVVGVSFDGRQGYIAALDKNAIVYISPDPTNIYDPNAIEVITGDGTSLGYIPKKMAATLNINTKIACTTWKIVGGGTDRHLGLIITFATKVNRAVLRA